MRVRERRQSWVGGRAGWAAELGKKIGAAGEGWSRDDSASTVCDCSLICLSVCLSICLSVCLSVCLYATVLLYVCLSIYLSVCLSVCLPLFSSLSVCLSVCLFDCLFATFLLFSCSLVCMSVCLYATVLLSWPDSQNPGHTPRTARQPQQIGTPDAQHFPGSQ